MIIVSEAPPSAVNLRAPAKLPVDLIDERLSSYEAQHELKSTRNLDPTSAKLILETWFRENTNFEHRQINNNKED